MLRGEFVSLSRAVAFASQISRIVIPSEARDLHLAADCRSLASLGMTKFLSLFPNAQSAGTDCRDHAPLSAALRVLLESAGADIAQRRARDRRLAARFR